MQSPGSTDVPFKYRGWTLDFDLGPEGDRFKLEEAQNAEALLLGRVTYEAMQAFWPTAEGEFADRLNELPKYVVSSTLTDPHWNATVLGDDWPEEVARLRKELDGDLLVYGSRRLSRALIGMGLVDELHLLVYPAARCRRSPVRGDAGQDPAASGRIASVRGRCGEHDLCTCHGGRVMRTLAQPGAEVRRVLDHDRHPVAEPRGPLR
jgi:dihydrofolate reductase